MDEESSSENNIKKERIIQEINTAERSKFSKRAAITISVIALGTAAVLLYLPRIQNYVNNVRKPVSVGQSPHSRDADSLAAAYRDSLSSDSSARRVHRSEPSTQISLEYIVRPGDNLSGIVKNILGLSGKEAYDALLNIQKINKFGPERDIYCYIDGRFYRGQDGITDLIFSGERIILK